MISLLQNHHAAAERGSAPVQLKVYRLAIAAQGEYSIFNGGTKPLVLSAIVEAMNFINAIQKRDFGVRFQLIANNDAIIYLDPATDPFTSGIDDPGTWFNENPGAINPVIGINNYDVGHAFCKRVISTDGTIGIAELGSVCKVLSKARASSSDFSPNYENFYFTTGHEMCHQMSGLHTLELLSRQCRRFNPAAPSNRAAGSTIMSYTNACGAQNNLQEFQEDPYFHLVNIIQVKNFVAQGDGNLCGESLDTDNNTPTASTDIPATGLYLPISTPFTLTGSGSDPDGDALTYCWEQYDLGLVPHWANLKAILLLSAPICLYRHRTEPFRVFKRSSVIFLPTRKYYPRIIASSHSA